MIRSVKGSNIRRAAGLQNRMLPRPFGVPPVRVPCPLYGPSPERKAVCRSEGEVGCGHIFGLFKELHFTLRALMEIRTPSPGQLSGLEGLGTGQV